MLNLTSYMDESDNNQMHSAQESLMKWLMQRGQFTSEDFASFIEAMDTVLEDERQV